MPFSLNGELLESSYEEKIKQDDLERESITGQLAKIYTNKKARTSWCRAFSPGYIA